MKMIEQIYVSHFLIESKSVNSEKHNQTVTIQVTEEVENRPGSSSTAPFFEVSPSIHFIEEKVHLLFSF